MLENWVREWKSGKRNEVPASVLADLDAHTLMAIRVIRDCKREDDARFYLSKMSNPVAARIAATIRGI